MYYCYSKHKTIRIISITKLERMASYALFFPSLLVFNKIHHLSSKGIYIFPKNSISILNEKL